MNSYFKHSTITLNVLYIFNIHTDFLVNWILFTFQSINSTFMHFFKLQKLKFKLQKLKFKQLIDSIAINFRLPWNFVGVNALLVPTFWNHFYFGPYILFLPLLVPKPINTWHLGPFRHSTNGKSRRGKRNNLLTQQMLTCPLK